MKRGLNHHYALRIGHLLQMYATLSSADFKLVLRVVQRGNNLVEFLEDLANPGGIHNEVS
jgi:hypothetical protein